MLEINPLVPLSHNNTRQGHRAIRQGSADTLSSNRPDSADPHGREAPAAHREILARTTQKVDPTREIWEGEEGRGKESGGGTSGHAVERGEARLGGTHWCGSSGRR